LPTGKGPSHGLPRRSRGPGPFLLLALLLTVPALHAQDSVIVINPDAPPEDSTSLGLPPSVISELLQTWNDSGTVRLPEGLTIPNGASMQGTIAAFRGTVRVGGEITGQLTVINGDLVILPGGVIHGDVLVAGGRMTLQDSAVVDGQSRVYWDAAPVVRQSDGRLAIRERRRSLSDLTAERTFGSGQIRTTLRLTTTQTYNRIEGLGIVFGPAFTWRASRALVANLDLRGILRTAADPSPFRRDLGWLVRSDWRFHGSRGFGFQARTYSLVSGIEEQTLPREEIGWNSFLFQRDNRDYYSAEGGGLSGYAYLTPRFRLEAGIRYEKEGSVRANDPWSLFRNSSQWRPNPLIDDGHYTITTLNAEYDTRNARGAATSSGWWLRGSAEHSSSNDVAPVSLPATIRSSVPTSGYGFNRFTLDLRRFNRLSPEIQLNFRVWTGGWLSGDPLPIQRRLSLGGPDLLPGYAFRALTCAPAGFTDASDPALCDRVLVTQAEFRHRLKVRAGVTIRDPSHRELDRFLGIEDPELVVFGDAGAAWLAGTGPGRVPSDRIRSLSEWKGDAGVGVDAGALGLYLVKAVTDGEPVRLYVRLERRF
jgi:hypothetical protein